MLGIEASTLKAAVHELRLFMGVWINVAPWLPDFLAIFFLDNIELIPLDLHPLARLKRQVRPIVLIISWNIPHFFLKQPGYVRVAPIFLAALRPRR